jgi:hypothetical protein
MTTDRLRRLAAAAGSLLLSLPISAAPPSRSATGALGAEVRAAIGGGTKRFDHTAWDTLLAGAVNEYGRVDYRFLQKRRSDLDRYLGALAAVKLSRLAPAELEALLINAYNAITVASILAHPSVKSIRDIDGVWDTTRHRVGGFELTLDDIEHTLLRPYFRDPRIHFAVNCASASCAPLPRWAFNGRDLDRQLDARARLFLSDARNATLEGDTLLVSRYFDWYGDDFTAPAWKPRAETVPEFVASYTTPELAARIRAATKLDVVFFDYDWSLNASMPPRP